MQISYQIQTFALEREHWWYRARHAIILSEFERVFGGRRDLRILEVGCGAGTLLSALRSFGDAVGVDSCPDAVREARQRACCPVYLGRFPDTFPAKLGSFDAICLFDVIEHLDDDVAALRCVRSLLKPGGKVVITVPALPWLFGVHDEINEHRRRYSETLLRGCLAESGFSSVHSSYFNTLLSPLLIPAIAWRNVRHVGHHFELKSRLSPVLECIFKAERHLMRRGRLPFGLSLFAVGGIGTAGV